MNQPTRVHPSPHSVPLAYTSQYPIRTQATSAPSFPGVSHSHHPFPGPQLGHREALSGTSMWARLPTRESSAQSGGRGYSLEPHVQQLQQQGQQMGFSQYQPTQHYQQQQQHRDVYGQQHYQVCKQLCILACTM